MTDAHAQTFTRPCACMTLFAFAVFGCSWDNPVWPKNKKSDTPLFRFVTNKKHGTGYIECGWKDRNPAYIRQLRQLW